MPRLPFAKGNPGRPKGSKNKVSQSIKEQHLAALDRVGGVEYLVKLAAKNPAVFMAGVHRMIPDEQKREDTIKVTFRHPDAAARGQVAAKRAVEISERQKHDIGAGG